MILLENRRFLEKMVKLLKSDGGGTKIPIKLRLTCDSEDTWKLLQKKCDLPAMVRMHGSCCKASHGKYQAPAQQKY